MKISYRLVNEDKTNAVDLIALNDWLDKCAISAEENDICHASMVALLRDVTGRDLYQHQEIEHTKIELHKRLGKTKDLMIATINISVHGGDKKKVLMECIERYTNLNREIDKL